MFETTTVSQTVPALPAAFRETPSLRLEGDDGEPDKKEKARTDLPPPGPAYTPLDTDDSEPDQDQGAKTDLEPPQ